MKDWSFGKLMGVFAGMMLVIIMIVAVVMSTGNKKPPPRVAKQRSETNFNQRTDIMAEQLRRQQEQEELLRTSSAEQQAALKKIIDAQAAQNNQLMQRLEGMSRYIAGVEQRIAYLEQMRRPTSVRVIKPERESRNDLAPKGSGPSRGAKTIPKPTEVSGYKVYATVGNRAWINDDSYTAGDELPDSEFVIDSVTRTGSVISTKR
jgi:hypothetical protein